MSRICPQEGNRQRSKFDEMKAYIDKDSGYAMAPVA